MAVTFNAAGTVASAASGNVTPGMPAGWAANDIHICFISSSDNIASTNAGYTSKQAVNNGTICRQTILWRRAVGGDTAPVITHTAGDSIIARIFGFRGCIASGDPIEAINGGSTGSGVPSGTLTATATAITPINPNAAILLLLTWTNNDTSNSGTTASYSGTNPAFAEIGDNISTVAGANECDDAIAWGIKTDTTTTGSRTAVYSTASVASTNWIATLLALTPDVAAASTIPPVHLPFMR